MEIRFPREHLHPPILLLMTYFIEIGDDMELASRAASHHAFEMFLVTEAEEAGWRKATARIGVAS